MPFQSPSGRKPGSPPIPKPPVKNKTGREETSSPELFNSTYILHPLRKNLSFQEDDLDQADPIQSRLFQEDQHGQYVNELPQFEGISPINNRNADPVKGTKDVQGTENTDLVQGAGALPSTKGQEVEKIQNNGPKANDTDITFTKGSQNPGNISDTMQQLANSTPLPPSPHPRSQTPEDRVRIPEYPLHNKLGPGN